MRMEGLRMCKVYSHRLVDTAISDHISIGRAWTVLSCFHFLVM